ncbi:MAG: sulfate adenylyltransferase subunit CysN, partial [Pseudomonadota bacterium]
MSDRVDEQSADALRSLDPALASQSSDTTGAETAHANDAADEKPILRFLTCGSVDDGKSTLIGRLLYDTNLVQDDTLETLETESKAFGTTGGDLDFALLVDGLQAERQQGITIDVAYRYFRTSKRKFIVADTPGHEQYTRNMVTGSSRCDLAIILVDARYGILPQTRRHSFITSLLGIRHVVIAINKMDLVDYAQDRFDEIDAAYRAFARELSFETIRTIPVSALKGENLITRSTTMDWYDGPSLLGCLEDADVTSSAVEGPLCMPVQWVCRPDRDFRGYAGTISSGAMAPGDPVVVMPSEKTAIIKSISTFDGPLERASAGDAVVATLDREIDIVRGDVLSSQRKPADVADQFAAHLVWMSEKPLLKGRPYLIRIGTQTAVVQVSEIKHAISMETLEPLASRTFDLNDIGVCTLTANKPLVLDSYASNKSLGSFILIDRMTNETVAAGMIQFALHRSQNIVWQDLTVSRRERSQIKGHRGCCLWFTGLSGSGKSTVANQLEKTLFERGVHTYILDGDNVRHGLNRDLGFTDAARVENVRRVAEVAKLMVDAGLVTIVSFISPFRSERQFARELFEDGEFVEVFVDTPLEVCETRDPKGLYK